MTALVDEYDIIRRWKKMSTLIVCCVLFLAGLPCTTQVAASLSTFFHCVMRHQ